MATKPIIAPDGTGSSQASNRYVDTFYDQHKWGSRFPNGRPWWGYREYAANRGDKDAFCCSPTPGDHNDPMGSNWHAPWDPETRFFEYNYLRNTIRIRYDYMIAEREQMARTYYAAVAKLCAANGWPEVPFGAMPRQNICFVVGEPPESSKIPRAAQAGDPWLLGFVEEPNEQLAKLLGFSATTGMKIETTEPVVEAKLTPDQVLAVSEPDKLAALIATIVAQTLDAREQAKKDKQAATMRAAKAKRTTAEAA